MGQDFSTEDLTFPYITQEQKYGTLDEFLEEISKKISSDRSVASLGIVFYIRHRTACGAPTISRSSTEDELKKSETVDTGAFPSPATEEEIREFDKVLFTGKHRKAKKKLRSRSFNDTNFRLPVLSRPKFVDKIITGYSSLTRKSPGKQKKYQKQLSLDQSTLCFDSSDNASISCVDENDDFFENGYDVTSVFDDVKFCSKCGLPILFEDVKNSSVDSDGLKVTCFSCLKERNNEQIYEDFVLPENVTDNSSHTPTTESLKWSHETPTLMLINPLFTEVNLCNSEGLDSHDNFERTNEPEPTSQVIDSDVIELDLPIATGHVRRQREAFIQLSQSYGSCPSLDKILFRSRSDCTVSIDKSVLRHIQKRPFCSLTEHTNRWAKNFFSLTKDSKFSQAVMAKGYVKALAEQINQQGTLKHVKDEEDEIEEAYSEMSKSTSSVASCKNDEVQVNLVHTLIQAAEQQKFKEDDTARPASLARKLNLPTNNNSLSQHTSESDCSVPLNNHLVSDFLTRSRGDFPPSSTDNRRKDNEIIQDSKVSVDFCQSSPAASPKSSASSSPKTSPTEFRGKDLRSSSTQKQALNHGPKPSIPAKPCLEKNAMLNACRSSATPSSSTPLQLLPSPASLSPIANSAATLPPSASSATPVSTPLPRLPITLSTTLPSPRSLTAHSPKSPATLPLTSPAIPSPVMSSPILKSSPKPKSPIPSAIALSSNPPLSPNSLLSPKTPSPLSAINLTFTTMFPISPTNTAPTSSITPPSKIHPTPPPRTPPPRTPSTMSPTNVSSPAKFKFDSQSSASSSSQAGTAQSSATSNSQAGTVQQWLRDTQSSLNSDTSSGDVCLRPSSKRSSDQYRDSVFKTIYDNETPLSAAELFDSSWSDSDDLNDISDEDDEEDDNSRKAHSSVSDVEHLKITDRVGNHLEDRRLHIAEELLQTERDYVARLHLLHHVFYFRLDNENRQQAILPADKLKRMFSNTKSIFLFHNDFVLPQLENRMQNWDNDPRIGDLMKKNAPFLKMYTEYIRNFDTAMKLINQWMEKSAKFSEIIQDIQKLPECRNLSLQHHMLGPIQRVPRYELLLKDYVKHLPKDSPDFIDATDALDLVTKAACHSNEAMNKIETFHKLLDIYQSLRGVPVDFISPTREFVTQGPVTKIAARSGEKQPRQIFLFNDLVLICTQYNLLGTFSVRSLLEVDGMEIKPGTSMHIPNTFLVHSKQRAVELLDENPTGEPIGWQEKIQAVISNYKKRKRPIKLVDPIEPEQEISVPESCLGKTAPVWIQDVAATMCMLCRQTFNMVRRRHHCRACGWLICKACSKKAPLEYNQGKIDRVCITCYNVIVNKQNVAPDSPDGKTNSRKKGLLHVSASTGLISGYMHCSDDGGHTWQKLWVTAHRDFVLYTFRAHEDVSAISSLPLPGHKVSELFDVPGRQHVFCLSHKKKKVWMFHTDNDKRLQRWTSVLTKLANAQLPEENSRLSSQSNSSNSSSISDSGTMNNDINSCNTKRSSTHSGSQADSGYPGDSNNSLAALVVDDNDHENTDGLSQYDNIDGVIR